MIKLTITEEHLKLISNLNVIFDNNIPSINPGRPFGNMDTHRDVCEVLDHSVNLENIKKVEKLLYESNIALQISLRRLSFQTGTFVTDNFYSDWRRILYTGEEFLYRGILVKVVLGIDIELTGMIPPKGCRVILVPMRSTDDIGNGAGQSLVVKMDEI